MFSTPSEFSTPRVQAFPSGAAHIWCLGQSWAGALPMFSATQRMGGQGLGAPWRWVAGAGTGTGALVGMGFIVSQDRFLRKPPNCRVSVHLRGAAPFVKHQQVDGCWWVSLINCSAAWYGAIGLDSDRTIMMDINVVLSQFYCMAGMAV